MIETYIIYTTEKNITTKNKRKLLQWILDNNFVEHMRTISIETTTDEDHNKFWEVYNPMLHKLLLRWEKEGKIKRCPKCNSLPMHPNLTVRPNKVVLCCESCGYIEDGDQTL